MGLDMYLNAKKYLSEYDDAVAEKRVAVCEIFGGLDVKEISVRAMYWRKANAIHNWFVENVQDGEDNCAPYHVSRENIEQLINDIATVLENRGEAEEILPTGAGFFFGSTDYDDYYFEELERTKNELTALINNPLLKGFEFEYQASW
jgi:hypothetical protein